VTQVGSEVGNAVGNERILLAIDGNSLVHRSFHAQASTGLRTADGRPMWAVRGLLSQLVVAVERIAPTAVVVGFDDPETSHRRERWPQYKANRGDKLDTLVEQLTLAIEVLRQMGVAVIVPPGLEADDVLASASTYAPTVGARTVIMTSDRDSFALINEHTDVLRIINGGVEASPRLTPSLLVTLLGVRPEQYRDFAALRGDASDNLPGVHGIGPKTAVKLLAAFGGARAAFDDLLGDGKAVEAAIGRGAAARLAHPDARTAWELNCQVMAMHHDLPLGLGGLDLGAGAGGLPLEANAVRAAFEQQQLPWTTANALRVLCGIESPVPAIPRREPWVEWSSRPVHHSRPAGRVPLKPLGKSSVKSSVNDRDDQLALF
jgi:5'-3' exonuclease